MCLGVTPLGGEGIYVAPGLLLFRALLAPLDVALLETTVDTDHQVVRDLREKYEVITGSQELEYDADVGLTPVASSATS